MGAIKAASGDAVLTFMWVFVSSMFGLFTNLIVTALGLQTLVWAPLVITTFIVFTFVFLFNLIGEALGGASFNPTGTASFYAAGVGGDTLFSMALRFPAQVYIYKHHWLIKHGWIVLVIACMHVFLLLFISCIDFFVFGFFFLLGSCLRI